MEYKKTPVDQLIPYANNARTHSEEQILKVASSIKEFGFINPVIIDGENGIIAGHCRVESAKRLGMTEVPTLEVKHLSEAQKKAYILADNRLAEDAGWDEELLRIELEGLAELDFDLDSIGFDISELDDIFPDEYDGEADGEIIEPPADPIAKLGDIYLLGRHRLMCGDSTKEEDVAKLMNGNKADMVFTDPPYGFNYVKKSNGQFIKNDGIEFEQIIADALALVDVDTAYVCGDAKTAGAFLRATSCLGEPKTCIVWSKPIQHRMHRYEPCHEFVWYWGDNGPPFYGTNVYEAKRAIEKYHPTVKPVELVEYCISSHGDKMLVLDLFGGSGSTLIACEQLNRTCYMMELDPAYCDVIINRWQTLTGQQAVNEATGEVFNVGAN